jgi:REP element-mobilizing transposase RayT
MPRIRRRFLLEPSEVGVYHCINRCVRRSFLCGTDHVSGKCYDHRKQWIQDRMQFLAANFGLDVLGFSIMSNHLHVVLRNRPDVVQSWSDLDVARRWWNVFPKRKDKHGNALEPTDFELQMIKFDPERVAEIRRRLSSVSWFMRCLVEPIARSANREDVCRGSFWEGRYKCVPLLDESALAACLAYVDLNPIRARIAETPETSRFTSAYERIQALVHQPAQALAEGAPQRPDSRRATRLQSRRFEAEPGGKPTGAAWLSPFELSEATVGNPVPTARASNNGCLPMTFAEYLNLLDWTGRQLRHDKRGAIPADLAPILERLHVSGEGWLQLMGRFSRLFRRVAGRPQSMRREREQRGCRVLQGMRHSQAFFF